MPDPKVTKSSVSVHGSVICSVEPDIQQLKRENILVFVS